MGGVANATFATLDVPKVAFATCRAASAGQGDHGQGLKGPFTASHAAKAPFTEWHAAKAPFTAAHAGTASHAAKASFSPGPGK